MKRTVYERKTNQPSRNYQLEFDSSKKDRCLMPSSVPKGPGNKIIFTVRASYNHQSLSDGHLCLALMQTQTHTHLLYVTTTHTRPDTDTHKRDIIIASACAHTDRCSFRISYAHTSRRLDTFLLTFFL